MQTRRPVLALAVSLLLVAGACASSSDTMPPETGNQQAEPTEKSLDGAASVTKIKASDGWLVNVSFGDSPSAQISFNEGDQDDFDAEISGDTLTLSAKSGTDISIALTATVTVKTLDEVTLTNGAKVTTAGTLDGDTFTATLDASGLYVADAELSSAKLTLNNVSTAVFTKGSIDTLTADVTNTSDLNTSGATSKTITLTASDSATAELGDSDTLNVTASDSSKVTYSGSPTITKTLDDNSTLTKSD